MSDMAATLIIKNTRLLRRKLGEIVRRTRAAGSTTCALVLTLEEAEALEKLCEYASDA